MALNPALETEQDRTVTRELETRLDYMVTSEVRLGYRARPYNYNNNNNNSNTFR